MVEFYHGLLLLTVVHLMAAASPGPDFVLVSQQTLLNGKRAGYLISIGIALGLSVHIIYSALGLATVIAHSTIALWIIKVLGGSYLIYLGFKGIRAKKLVDNQIGKAKAKESSAPKIIAIGFFANALNPKAPIYFIALFTVVLTPNMPLYQIAIYGIWMMILQLSWFSFVVLFLSIPRIRDKFQKFGHWIDRVLGGAMIALGIKILATKTN